MASQAQSAMPAMAPALAQHCAPRMRSARRYLSFLFLGTRGNPFLRRGASFRPGGSGQLGLLRFPNEARGFGPGVFNARFTAIAHLASSGRYSGKLPSPIPHSHPQQYPHLSMSHVTSWWRVRASDVARAITWGQSTVRVLAPGHPRRAFPSASPAPACSLTRSTPWLPPSRAPAWRGRHDARMDVKGVVVVMASVSCLHSIRWEKERERPNRRKP